MVKRVNIKTTKNSQPVEDYLDGLDSPAFSEQGYQLLGLFSRVTGCDPKMWGGIIVGFGEYVYHRANGDEGLFMATGFSMRKSGPVLYIMPGYATASVYLDRLGPHKLGKSCLYIKRLSDVDLKVVEELIVAGLDELKESHTVRLA